jgi:hypothetical protein
MFSRPTQNPIVPVEIFLHARQGLQPVSALGNNGDIYNLVYWSR